MPDGGVKPPLRPFFISRREHHRQPASWLGHKRQLTAAFLHASLLAGILIEPADEKVARHDVAAGLPRHISIVFNAGWRRKAASTSFFHQPPRASPPASKLAWAKAATSRRTPKLRIHNPKFLQWLAIGPGIRIKSVRPRPFWVTAARAYTEPSLPTAMELTSLGLWPSGKKMAPWSMYLPVGM